MAESRVIRKGAARPEREALRVRCFEDNRAKSCPNARVNRCFMTSPDVQDLH